MPAGETPRDLSTGAVRGVAVLEIAVLLDAALTVRYRMGMADDVGVGLAYLYDVLTNAGLILLFNLLYLLFLYYLCSRKRGPEAI